MSENRTTWNSNIGFILAAAGSAIGLGNIWKFPYIVGQHGGAAFVILYIVMVVVMGFPFLLAETALGRHARTNMVDAYKVVSPKWAGIGVINFAASFLLLSYYGVLGGWVLHYLVVFLRGGIVSGTEQAAFTEFTGSGLPPILWMGVFVAIYAFIVSRGITKGIEKFSKFAMPLLFVMMLIVAIRSVTLPNAAEGLRFFLKPDFSKIDMGTIGVAASQAFYSLSLGMGALITYGSYVKRDANIVHMSVAIPVLDTVIALLSGFAILPAVFAFGYDPQQGPGLIFVILPAVFDRMAFGRVLGVGFFVLVLFAAITSAISLMENLLDVVSDKLHLTRGWATLLIAAVMFLAGLPSALAFGPMQDVVLLGRNVFDLVDFVVSHVLLPAASLLMTIFIGYVWRANQVRDAITSGGRYTFRLWRVWRVLMRYILPIVIAAVFLQAIGILRFS